MVDAPESKSLTIHTSVEVCRHLDRLAKTGLFGGSRSGVARHLLSQRLLEALREAKQAGLLEDDDAEAGEKSEEL